MEKANSVRMTSKAEQVLEQALQLSESERADVAARLLRSLDTEIDEDAEEEWNKEIDRRIDELESGQAELISLDEARRQWRARHQH